MSQNWDQDQDPHGAQAGSGSGPAWAPKRRRCALCERAEASYPLHLVGIWVDGKPRRACDECRERRTYFCQICGLQQGGQRHTRAGLSLCAECAAKLDRGDAAPA